jgi:flagellar hook-length control protein FliK
MNNEAISYGNIKQTIPSFMANRENSVSSLKEPLSTQQTPFMDILKNLHESRSFEPARNEKPEYDEKPFKESTLQNETMRSTEKPSEEKPDKEIENSSKKDEEIRTAEEQIANDVNRNEKIEEVDEKKIIADETAELKKNLRALLEMMAGALDPEKKEVLKDKIDSISEKITALLNQNEKQTGKDSIKLKKMLVQLQTQLDGLKKEMTQSDKSPVVSKTLLESLKIATENLNTKRKSNPHPSQINQNTAQKTEDSEAVFATAKNSKESNTSSPSQDNSFSFSRETSQAKLAEMSARDGKASDKAPGLFKEQINDLINKAQITVKDKGNGTINLKMFPERLGNVTVNLGLENGTLSGKFLVDSKEARDTLLSQFDQLKARLSEEGIELGSFSVDVKEEKNAYSDYKENKETFEALTTYANKGSHAAEEYMHLYSGSEKRHEGSINLVM